MNPLDGKDPILGGLTCEQFQDGMPDLISSGEDLRANPHLVACERCSSLVSDLVTIAEAARKLMQMPEEEPREEVWQQIQLAIARGDA